MSRLLIAISLVASLKPLGAHVQIPAEPISARLLIDVVALDKSGMPVPDLRREELEVWLSGYRVPIETLEVVTPASGGRGGRSIVLLLDDVTLRLDQAPRVRDAARRFVDKLLPGDVMAIVTLNGTAMETTSDRNRLLQSIDAYRVQTTGVLRVDTLGQHVLETVGSLSRQLAETSNRRKTIVAIGAGWLFDRPLPPPTLGRDLRPEWIDAMRAMAFANVSLYVIDPAGLGMSPADSGSSGFARETGGRAFLNTNDVNDAADRIIRETGDYYVIWITDPPVGKKAALRELDVRVLRRGITVRARRGIPGAR